MSVESSCQSSICNWPKHLVLRYDREISFTGGMERWFKIRTIHFYFLLEILITCFLPKWLIFELKKVSHFGKNMCSIFRVQNKKKTNGSNFVHPKHAESCYIDLLRWLFCEIGRLYGVVPKRKIKL